eukprot:3217333-Rhodomonas_salina.2
MTRRRQQRNSTVEMTISCRSKECKSPEQAHTLITQPWAAARLSDEAVRSLIIMLPDPPPPAHFRLKMGPGAGICGALRSVRG